MKLQDYIVADYSAKAEHLNGFAGSRFHVLRQQAFEQLSTQSFPTVKNEEWKYTNVQALVAQTYTTPETTIASVDEYCIPDMECIKVVFVNGEFSATLSDSLSDIHGLTAGSLHNEYASNKEVIDEKLGTAVNTETNAFTTANTAVMNDGLFVNVAKNTIVEKPLYVLSIVDATAGNTLVQPRHLLLFGENSQATVIFRTVTLGANSSVTNQIVECFAERAAIVNCYVVQDDSENASIINTHNTHQNANSVLNIVTVSLSGAIIRNTVGTKLNEQNTEAHMYGLYVTDGKTHVDNHTVMDHAVANCHSNELYKGILDGNSQGVFNGKIFVREDAQKTLAYQSNRNILLSNTATVNTKPQLEIWADDVKCSHGCTVGQLDEEALFYLRARGIGERNAKALLLTAFAEDITEKISIEALRNFINSKIEQRLIQ
ncbi:MAG: Fe-S cluster assembly protein SufD [Candidatus Kapaibacterium sp.]